MATKSIISLSLAAMLLTPIAVRAEGACNATPVSEAEAKDLKDTLRALREATAALNSARAASACQPVISTAPPPPPAPKPKRKVVVAPPAPPPPPAPAAVMVQKPAILTVIPVDMSSNAPVIVSLESGSFRSAALAFASSGSGASSAATATVQPVTQAPTHQNISVNVGVVAAPVNVVNIRVSPSNRVVGPRITTNVLTRH